MEPHINDETAQRPIPSHGFTLSGDREVVNDILGSQRRRLYSAALRLLGNTEDAEDAVQEGLLAALRNLHRFEGRARLSTWLTRIVVNAALMRLRNLRAHESEPIDEPMMQEGSRRLSDQLVDGRPNPEEVCARAEQRRILHQGLECLSRPQRRALSLHDFQGLTTKETALALGLSEGTVKSQVHRGRRKLSEQVRKIQQVRAFGEPARA
ncbi:MAG TPA: sigma-70 family RNA polymerase sigma factor [Candidatus Eisenbacteria bacterium]|nr:sigma-70 family RNA polymerase sigma factor [Candidatus Eisenbacteria bacterium]